MLSLLTDPSCRAATYPPAPLCLTGKWGGGGGGGKERSITDRKSSLYRTLGSHPIFVVFFLFSFVFCFFLPDKTCPTIGNIQSRKLNLATSQTRNRLRSLKRFWSLGRITRHFFVVFFPPLRRKTKKKKEKNYDNDDDDKQERITCCRERCRSNLNHLMCEKSSAEPSAAGQQNI